MDLKLDHVHAVATDLDASIAFYGMLGFKLLRRVEFGPDDDRKQLAYVGNQGTVIELVMPRDQANPIGGGTGVRPFAMYAEHVDDIVRELEAEGVEILVQPRPGFSFTGKTAVVQDPSGLEIELREWGNGDSPSYPGWTPERADVVNITE